MKQSLEKKHSAKIVAFALLLTMLTWLVPANVEVAKAADMTKSSAVKVGKPLYKKCEGQAYSFKNKQDEVLEAHFRKASKGKIKFYLVRGVYGSGFVEQTGIITGKVKGKTISFKANKWYSTDEGGAAYCIKEKISGKMTLKNNKVIKLKITSGKSKIFSFLRKGKTLTLKRI